MATQRTNITTSLKIKVENGTTDAGAVKYATRTFSSINPEISDEDLLAVARRRRHPARRERNACHGLNS